MLSQYSVVLPSGFPPQTLPYKHTNSPFPFPVSAQVCKVVPLQLVLQLSLEILTVLELEHFAVKMSNEVQERLQREREAAAFLSSLGPQFEKVRSISPGPPAAAGKTAGVNGHGVVANGNAGGVPRPAAAPSSAGKGGTVSTSVVTVSREAEEKRQQALRRLKATHCSVNQEKVS